MTPRIQATRTHSLLLHFARPVRRSADTPRGLQAACGALPGRLALVTDRRTLVECGSCRRTYLFRSRA